MRINTRLLPQFLQIKPTLSPSTAMLSTLLQSFASNSWNYPNSSTKIKVVPAECDAEKRSFATLFDPAGLP